MKFIGTLLQQHVRRYPLLELADVYKLLHQAALGPGHAIDLLSARERLQQEIAVAGDCTDEPMPDPISPDGKLVRVHLRAYVNAGHDLDALSDAFARTAREYPPSLERLERFCGCLGDLASAGGIPFTREDAVGYVAKMAMAGYPAVHHSDAYRSPYRPAYRVVAIEYLPKIAA